MILLFLILFYKGKLPMKQSESKKIRKFKNLKSKKLQKAGQQNEKHTKIMNVLQNKSISDIDAIKKCYQIFKQDDEIEFLKKTFEGICVYTNNNERELSLCEDLAFSSMTKENFTGAPWCYLEEQESLSS